MPPLEPARLDLAPHHLATLRSLLEQHVPEAEVWAFGSRVNGGAHDGSDLDLVLRNPHDLSASVTGWAALLEAVQASALPMLVEVHDWASMPSAFRGSILQSHWVLHVPQPRAQAEAIHDMPANTLLSEPSLARDWTSSDEVAAWAHLHRGR